MKIVYETYLHNNFNWLLSMEGEIVNGKFLEVVGEGVELLEVLFEGYASELLQHGPG